MVLAVVEQVGYLRKKYCISMWYRIEERGEHSIAETCLRTGLPFIGVGDGGSYVMHTKIGV